MTLQGPFVVNNNRNARLVGTIANQGSIRMRSSSDSGATALVIGREGAPNVSFIGGGEIILGDSAPGFGGHSARVDASVPNASLSLDAQTLRGFGVVGYGFNNTARWLHLTNNALINADVNAQGLAFVPNTLTNSTGKVMKATNGGFLYFNPAQLTNTGASIQATNGSSVFFGPTALTSGLVNSEAGGTINMSEGLTANGGVTFANAGTTVVGSAGGQAIFSGLDNGGSTFINSGTIRKINNAEYHMHTALNHTGSIITEAGVLRLFGGGMVSNANSSAAAGTDLTFQGAQRFTFSGNNVMSGSGNHWLTGAISLADAAAQISVTNFNFAGGPTLSGPGTLEVSSKLYFHPYRQLHHFGSEADQPAEREQLDRSRRTESLVPQRRAVRKPRNPLDVWLHQ
jgi:hypothetical protein